MKKEWKQPELIVIVKTELEEDVLAACKKNAPKALGGCVDEVTGPTNTTANS